MSLLCIFIGDTVDTASGTLTPPPPLPTTMDQQMTSTPMEPQPMQGISDSGGTAMETSSIPDMMPPNPTNYPNHHSSEMPSINGHHQTPSYQPVQTIYKTMQQSNNNNNNNGSSNNNNNNNNNENHKHDNNQNFVHDLNMYGTRSSNTHSNYRPQDIPTQLQSDVQMTGSDPMMNSTAIIQQNNTPTTTFARKITRSMHQQNLMHLQHSINGASGGGGGSDFKVELKDEPENGF